MKAAPAPALAKATLEDRAWLTVAWPEALILTAVAPARTLVKRSRPAGVRRVLNEFMVAVVGVCRS